MHLRAAPPRHLETQSNLDAFHRLNAHQRLGQAAVQLAVPLRMRTQSRGQTQRHHFEDATQRVALLLTLLDQSDHPGFGVAIGGAHGRLFRAGVNLVEGKPADIRRDVAERADVPHDANTKRRQQLLSEGANRGARHGFTSARSLENIANVGAVIFEDAV